MDRFQISEAILEHTVLLNDINNICEIGGIDRVCDAILAIHNQEVKSLHRLIATMSGDISDADMVYNGWLSPEDANTVTEILNKEKQSDLVFAKKIESDAKRSQEMMLQIMEREEDSKAKTRDKFATDLSNMTNLYTRASQEVTALKERIKELEDTIRGEMSTNEIPFKIL